MVMPVCISPRDPHAVAAEVQAAYREMFLKVTLYLYLGSLVGPFKRFAERCQVTSQPIQVITT